MTHESYSCTCIFGGCVPINEMEFNLKANRSANWLYEYCLVMCERGL